MFSQEHLKNALHSAQKASSILVLIHFIFYVHERTRVCIVYLHLRLKESEHHINSEPELPTKESFNLC